MQKSSSKKLKENWEWKEKQVRKEQNTKQQEIRFKYPFQLKLMRMTTKRNTSQTFWAILSRT